MSAMVHNLAGMVTDGLAQGAAYALLGVAFTLVFGILGRLNLALGPAAMLGAYAGTYAFVEHQAGIAAVMFATLAVALAAGLYVERVSFRALAGASAVASLVSTFAVWMQLEEAATLLLPRHTYPFPELPGLAAVMPGDLPERLLLLPVAVATVGGLRWLLDRTRFGLAVRAVTDHPRAAGLMGIDANRTLLWVFALASLIAGMTVFLLAALDRQITPMLGMWMTTKGLVAALLGGLGSLGGALAGGLVLGLVEAGGQYLFGPVARDLAAYALVFAVLVLNPGALCPIGERQI